MEVRDETYDQLNSYFIRHCGLRDHGLFPSYPDGNAPLAAASIEFRGHNRDGSSRGYPDGVRDDAERAYVYANPSHGDTGPANCYANTRSDSNLLLRLGGIRQGCDDSGRDFPCSG